MTTLNAYATLQEFKDFVRSRGGSVQTDTTDDAVVELLLKSASRYIESATGRNFTPLVETRYYDVPSGDEIDPRMLKVDGDLLEVITLTNGDGTVVSSTEYSLRPKNTTPHFGIRLVDNSTYVWASDGAGDTHDVISVLGFWGYHNHYSSLAWYPGGTSSEAMDASETGLDVVSNANFVVGDLIKYDNELGYVSAVPTNSLTITRGENGSTATTHLTGISVYIWRVMEEAKNACLEMAFLMYKRRFEANNSGQTTATEAISAPPEIPEMTRQFVEKYRAML